MKRAVWFIAAIVGAVVAFLLRRTLGRAWEYLNKPGMWGY